MTEQRLAAELDHQMRLAGADGPAFPTICAVDASASMPHARPGGRRLKRGSVLLTDFGAIRGGYVCDLTRVLSAGKMAPRVRAVYDVVREAQAAGIAAVGPGRAAGGGRRGRAPGDRGGRAQSAFPARHGARAWAGRCTRPPNIGSAGGQGAARSRAWS